jgi:hypothetical protein
VKGEVEKSRSALLVVAGVADDELGASAAPRMEEANKAHRVIMFISVPHHTCLLACIFVCVNIYLGSCVDAISLGWNKLLHKIRMLSVCTKCSIYL